MNPNKLSNISIRGFKSISERVSMQIRPLTILSGANSSGKSSMMQPLLLLKQTLESAGDTGPLLLDGPNVRFTNFDQLLSNTSKTQDFEVILELNKSKNIGVVFRSENHGVQLVSMTYGFPDDVICITQNMTHEQIDKQFSKEPMVKNFPKFFNVKNEDVRWEVSRERCFYSLCLTSTRNENSKFVIGSPVTTPAMDIVPCLMEVIHLPGLRGNPQRTYPRSVHGPNFPGTFENYVASIIAHWQSSEKHKLYELCEALEKMGLTWKIKADHIDDTQVEIKVGRLPHGKKSGAHDLVSIADVGFGVSQALPVVVALIVARSGQVVYLEQPEIHLHPLAQRRLAHIVHSAIERGVIVIVETHSALLLKEIQMLVASGKLDTQKVGLHWFQREAQGNTAVKTAELDDNGAYGAWPADFDTVELEAEKEYLDAVERRHK